MPLRILVTGASGFIGNALVPALAAQGHVVRAAARRATDAGPCVEHVFLPDIARPVDWMPLLAGIDIVVHLAGIAHRQGGDAIDYDQANRGATADLAVACHAAGIQKMIFMSSIGALTGSASDRVLTEADAPNPVTDYDRAKLAAEDAVRRSGAPYTILRPVIVYGCEPKANVALLAKLAALPFPLPFGAFHNRRSLLALDNLIAAVVLCLDEPRTLNQMLVVSDPRPITLAGMLAVMRRAMGRRPNLVPVPPTLFKWLFNVSGRSLLWDRVGRDLVVNPQKLLDVGWQPVVTTEQGLTRMMQGIATKTKPKALLDSRDAPKSSS